MCIKLELCNSSTSSAPSKLKNGGDGGDTGSFMDRLPMNSYFQIRPCCTLERYTLLPSNKTVVTKLVSPPCSPLHRVGLLLSVSGSVLAEQIGRRGIFSRTFACQGN